MSSEDEVPPMPPLFGQPDNVTNDNNLNFDNTSRVIPNSVEEISQVTTILIREIPTLTTVKKIPLNGVVLPRNKNQTFSNLNKYDMNIDQLSYYRDIINTHCTKKYHDLSNESEKVTFVNGLMREYFRHKIVYEYNEESDDFSELTSTMLFQKIRGRLINIKAYQKCISSKRTRPTETNEDTQMENDEEEVKQKRFSMDDYERSHPYLAIYATSKKLFCPNDWHYYSMFHSLYQSFSFVVYNYSHRIADSEIVHRSTRLKINFPKNCNAVLITHGRLVHSGSRSKYENNQSYNHSHDLRLHSYLIMNESNNESGINCSMSSSSSRRSSSRIEVGSSYTNHTPEGQVDRCTFRMCGPNCKLCVTVSSTKELNIEDIYNQKKIRVGHTIKQKPRKIIGDLQKFGWVVYTGVNVHHKKYSYNLSNECSMLVEKQPKRMWHGIGGTERRAFKLDELRIDNSSKANSDIHSIETFFDDILQLVLNNTSCFKDKVQMKRRSLLANFGNVEEQTPHRDFGSSRCNDPNRINNNI